MATYGGGILGNRAVETDGVLAKLRTYKNKHQGSAWDVSFETYYAEWVHEDLTKYHAPPTQAKFLEQPAREFSGIMADIVRNVMALGRSLSDATYSAARFLLFQSQKITPVDTGALRRSGQVTDARLDLSDTELGTESNPFSLD